MSAMPQPRPEPRSLSSVPVIARLSSDNVIDGFEVAALPLKPAVSAEVKAQPSEGKENREVDIEECEYDSDEGTESPPLYRGVTGFPGAQVLDSLREEVFSLCHPESLPRLMEEFEEVETLERRWDYLLEAREFLLECDADAPGRDEVAMQPTTADQLWSRLHHVSGDATDAARGGSGPKIVAHLCSHRSVAERGRQHTVTAKWPAAAEQYRAWRLQGRRSGDVLLVPTGARLTLASVVADSRDASCEALARGLAAVGAHAEAAGASVHMQRGRGWERAEPLLHAMLATHPNVEAFVYDKP
jgi:hypothetical protein